MASQLVRVCNSEDWLEVKVWGERLFDECFPGPVSPRGEPILRAWYVRCSECGERSPPLVCCGKPQKPLDIITPEIEILESVKVLNGPIWDVEYVFFVATNFRAHTQSQEALRLVCLAECEWVLFEKTERIEGAERLAKESQNYWALCRILLLISRIRKNYLEIDDIFRKAFPTVPDKVERSQIFELSKRLYLSVGITVQQITMRDDYDTVPARRALPRNQYRLYVPDLLEFVKPSWYGHRLALAVLGGIAVLDTDTKKEEFTFPANNVCCIVWSGDGRKLYWSDSDGKVCEFNLETKLASVIIQEEADTYCHCLAAHPTELLAGVWKNKRKAWICIMNGSKPLFRCSLSSRRNGCMWSFEYLAFFDDLYVRFWSIKTCIVEAVSSIENLEACGWSSSSKFCTISSNIASDYRLSLNCPGFSVMVYNEFVQIFDESGVLWKSIACMQDVFKTRVCQAVISTEKRLVVTYSNDEILIDPDVSKADIQIENMQNLSLVDSGDEVKNAVSHLANYVNLDDIEWDETVKISRTHVLFGIYRKRVKVAVKRCDAESVQTIGELFHLASLDRHKNLIPFLGFTFLRSYFCLVSEWLGGTNLEVFLETNKIMEFQKVHIVLCIARALEWLHKHQTVHGDIKADNVVGDPEFWEVRLIDLGIARPTSGHPHLNGTVGKLYVKSHVIILKPADDVRILKDNIMSLFWDPPIFEEEEELKSLLNWLERYRLHIVRHARIKAHLILPSGASEVEVRQRCGTIIWNEVVELFRKHGADDKCYRLFKLDSHDANTICILGCTDVSNNEGKRTIGAEILYQSYHRSKWILPVESFGRAAQLNEICSELESVEFYGPVLVFEDTSCDLANSTPQQSIFLKHDEFDLTDHPVIPSVHCSFKALWATRGLDENRNVMPWCL